jgi:hypothetical protein
MAWFDYFIYLGFMDKDLKPRELALFNEEATEL